MSVDWLKKIHSEEKKLITMAGQLNSYSSSVFALGDPELGTKISLMSNQLLESVSTIQEAISQKVSEDASLSDQHAVTILKTVKVLQKRSVNEEPPANPKGGGK